MKALRGFSGRLLLLIILPFFLLLLAVALGSVLIHQLSMRTMVGERDLRAVRTAAAALSAEDGWPSDEQIRDVVSSLQMGPRTAVFLVDRQGHTLMHIGDQETDATSHPGVPEALAGRSGSLYHRNPSNGMQYAIAYAPVQPQGWALVIAEPWGEVTSPWLRGSLLAPLVLVPAVASAFLLLWLGVQHIVRPLQQLDAHVTALGWGDFDAVKTPIDGIQEIKELQRALVSMAAQLRAYQQSMRGYVGAVTSAQEEERKRLARELHDDTIQSLVALNQRIQAARRRALVDPSEIDGQLMELQAMLDETMDQVRRFTRALRPIYLEEAGLVAALEALVRDTSGMGLCTRLEVRGDSRRLAPEVELAVYRIVQEALNNVVRHARATSAQVRVDFRDHDVAVRVEDDGIGFRAPERVSELVAAGHYGLMGMQERAQLAGARLAVRSQPGRGTVVEVCI